MPPIAIRCPRRDFAEGAALLMTYGTSIHALVDRGHIEGDTLLVLGASGGVGIAAVELGKAFGARVVSRRIERGKGRHRTSGRRRRSRRLWLSAVRQGGLEALANMFKTAVGGDGANVIYDAVGGDYCEPALRSIAWEGRYLVVGFPAGIPRLPLNLTLLKSCDVAGVFWGAFAAREPQRNRANISACSSFGNRARSARASPNASRWRMAARRSPSWATAARSASWS